MKSRKLRIGLTLFCIVVFSAVAASTASAGGETAFTCVEGGGTHNTDSHCTPGSSGNFGHVAIAVWESTQLTLTATGNQTIVFEVFGAEVELIGSGLKCEGCMFNNFEGLLSKSVLGYGGRLVYTGMSVAGTLGTNCEVKDPTTGAGTVRTEELTFISLDWKAMRAEPETGTEYMVIHFVSKPGKICPIAGTFTVEGDLGIGLSGANFTLGTLRGELWTEGSPLLTSGTATAAAGLTEGAHHPVVLTAT